MDPTNPFLSTTSDQLARSFTKAAQDLSENRPRTREERIELAQRVRQLLLAGALRMAPTGSWFSRPEVARRSEDFFDCARADYAQRLREVRYTTLRQAAEHKLASRADTWLRDSVVGTDRVYDLALSSDAGLHAVLDELSRMT